MVRKELTEHNKDWLRFIIHELLSNCNSIDDLLENKITFVTFNYDVSLERNLYERLCAIDLFMGCCGAVNKFLKDNIIHVYGKIYPGDGAYPGGRMFQRKKDQSVSEGNYLLSDMIDSYTASKNIRVILDDKDEDQAAIKLAREKLAESDVVYILGYGFDENNSNRLNLSRLKPTFSNTIDKRREIYSTNYGDKNIINKKVGNALFNDQSAFLHQDLRRKYDEFLCEKSIKSVYDALAACRTCFATH